MPARTRAVQVIRQHLDTLVRCDAVEPVVDDDVPADRRRYRSMLDEEGWQAITDLLAGVLEEAMEIAAESADRQARGAAEPLFGTTLAMLHLGRAERPAPGREA